MTASRVLAVAAIAWGCIASRTVAAQATPVSSPATLGCAPDATCPPTQVPGTVVVGLAFDGLGSRGTSPDGALRSDEIQCAIDCLDGDPAPEHVLPATLTYRDAPPFVSGGTLVFVPESPPAGVAASAVVTPAVRYVIDAPLDLPFSASNLTLRGEGATLRVVTPPSAPSRTIFRRIAPASASPRDVEYLSAWTNGWRFEGFTFIDPRPGLPGAPSTAIELHGAYHLVVDRCQFQNLDRGVDLHFCIAATVRDCFFTGGRDVDVVVGDGADCGAVAGPCWTGTEGWLRDSGSHHARLLNTHHITDPSATASILVVRSVGPVIDGVAFEGTRPQHSLVVRSSGQATTVMVRDAYVEFAEDARPGSSTLRFECGGIATIEGLSHVGAYAGDVLVDLAGASDLQVRMERCGWLAPSVQFDNGANRWANRWAFRDVVAAGAPLADPSRWRGAGVPVNLVVGDAPAAKPAAPAPAESAPPAGRRKRR